MDPNRMKAAVAAALLLLVATVALSAGDIARHRSCNDCGMDRKAYGYSRMLVVYEDGSEVGTCSLRCAAAEIEGCGGKTLKSLLVADHDSRELIDAGKAIWVMGGKKRGVMTRVPKWAFKTRGGAEAFVKAHGGDIVPWEEALAAAKKELK